jgi:hypothetical protein
VIAGRADANVSFHISSAVRDRYFLVSASFS